MSAALHSLTLSAAAEMIRRRACSSEELTRALLARIESADTRVRSYLSVDAEDAVAQAREADRGLANGSLNGPLAGVPISIKDVISVKGHPCSCASKILQGYHSPYDATAIARLRAAGATFIGRLNMDEFAMGSSTENSGFHPTRNPWNLDCVPGGSSGGSAAAAAGDLAIATLGTDTGGSIRQPAAFCGCVGLKPSYGRVSRYGAVAFASSLDQIGPITKDVRDAAILLSIMAGQDAMDATSAEAPVPDYTASLGGDLKGLRVGLPKECFAEGIDADVRTATLAAIEQCKALGAEVVEISLPMTPYAIAVYYVLATAEASANLARFDGVRYGFRADASDPIEMYERTRAAGFGAEVKRRIILGTYALSSGYYDAYYLRAQKVRTLIRRDYEEAFKKCDAILSPTTPMAAFKFGEKANDPVQMYLADAFTVTASLAGICGISVPCGFTPARLPVGLQILGPAFREDLILRIGHAYEQSMSWHKERPCL